MSVTEQRAAQITALAELIVSDAGVNVQGDQVVGITAWVGMEPIWRAVAEAAYARGARFVDPWIFDAEVKHSRLARAPLDTVDYRPPWWGERYLSLGEMAGAEIRLAGEVAPGLMDDITPERLGLDIMPRLPEKLRVTHARQWNWIVAPGPNPGWAAGLYPELDPEAAVDRMWEELGFILRLNEPDPAAAWRERFAQLQHAAEWLNAQDFDALHLAGPGTDLTVGLLPGSVFKRVGADSTVAGVPFTCNLPSEEVFSAPDPLRVEGYVASTKPLVVGGGVVRGLAVVFEAGRAVRVEAQSGAGLVRSMIAKDEGAARLGEVALVDGASRVGQLGTVFSDTLLDENSASHVAFGAAYPDTVEGADSLARINHSSIHIDFMIGSPELSVAGVDADGTRTPVLVGGAWQF